MKKDWLRDDHQKIHNLDELIKARSPGLSQGRDSLSTDIEIPDDTDVEEALTFPHPHHKKPKPIDLMDTPHEEDMDEDWTDQDLMPSDYSHGYSEATTTDVRDEADEIAEDEVHAMDHLSLDQMSTQTPTEIMPNQFTPDSAAS